MATATSDLPSWAREPSTELDRQMVEEALREYACPSCGAAPAGNPDCPECAAEPAPRVVICRSCGWAADLDDPRVVEFHQEEVR